MFIDEIEDLSLTETAWQTAANFSHDSNCFDILEVALGPGVSGPWLVVPPDW